MEEDNLEQPHLADNMEVGTVEEEKEHRPKLKRKQFTIAFKKEVLDWINADDNRTAYQAAQHFGNITQATIRGWVRQADEIESFQLTKRARRVPGAGRKALLEEFETLIVDMILMERAEKHRVRRSDVLRWARGIARENNIDNFKASDHWLHNFMQRNGLSLRKRTNLTTLDDNKLLNRAFEFMKYLKRKVRPEHDLKQIVLMDETAVYLEDPRENTVDITGARHVIIKSTGFSSMRITCMLAIRADGSKITPVIISKKARSQNELVRKNGLFYFYNEKAWINQDLLCKYMDFVFPDVLEGDGKLLVWDSARPHIARSVKAHMLEKGISQAVIPGGLTAYLQAGDIGIYKSFKDNISVLIEQWKSSGDVSYTAAGNPRPPPENVVADWVKTAWRQIPSRVIEKSIEAAGFGEWESWFISKHDVYGPRFKALWRDNMDELGEEQDIDAIQDDPLLEVEDDSIQEHDG